MSRWLPENISTYGGDIDKTFYIIYYLTGVVFLLVAAAMVYYMFKYRDRGDGRRAIYTHGNNTLEIVWTILPAVIFLVLGISAERTWAKIKIDLPEPDLIVRVDAHQFNWMFTYPGPDGEFAEKEIKAGKPKTPRRADGKNVDDIDVLDNLVVPVNQVVQLNMNAVDVLHSLFVPELRFKQDHVPGKEVKGWFKATKTGSYEIACAELCGFGHTGMKGRLWIVEEAEWARLSKMKKNDLMQWIIDQAPPVAESGS